MKRRTPDQSADCGTSWERMLRATPVRNAAASVQRRSDDEVRISIPRRRPRYLAAPLTWIVRPKPTRTVILDRLGTQIWEGCDGKRSVEDVVDSFAQTHRLSFHESRVAVAGYIKTLIERGALAIVMPPRDDANPAETRETMSADQR